MMKSHVTLMCHKDLFLPFKNVKTALNSAVQKLAGGRCGRQVVVHHIPGLGYVFAF